MDQPVLLTFGFPDTASPRYRNVVKTYENEGWEVRECLTNAKGFWGKHKDLLRQFRDHKREYDALLVSFPGYYLMPIAWLLTRLPRKQLLFDAFISISDTLVSDRRKVSWLHPLSWMYFLADIVSLHLADEVLIDTNAHKRFFANRFRLKGSRIRVIYVGTRMDLFTPGPKTDLLDPAKFNVLFVGSYIPLQGIEYIVHAAALLEKENDIAFTLVGKGQTYDEITTLAYELNLQNITFIDTQPIEKLQDYYRSCDVALGIFGLSQKAGRVIAHKIYDAVACEKPVITAANFAIGEQFEDGKEVFLCDAGDGGSLAAAILRVRKVLGE